MINENYQLQLIENIFVRGEYTDIPNYPIAIRYKKIYNIINNIISI